MKTNRLIPILVLVLIISSACRVLAPKPTATPVPTATSLPTETPTPESTSTPRPTSTTKPTRTPTRTPRLVTRTPSEPDIPEPVGKPVKEWEGIPVMPGALAGEGDSTSYTYTIQSTVADVQEYYDKVLEKQGWIFFASSDISNTDAIMLMYMKDNKFATVSVIPQDDGIVYVLIVKV